MNSRLLVSTQCMGLDVDNSLTRPALNMCELLHIERSFELKVRNGSDSVLWRSPPQDCFGPPERKWPDHLVISQTCHSWTYAPHWTRWTVALLHWTIPTRSIA